MNGRTVAVALGSGLTAFLVVAVVVVEIVQVDPGAGILGVLLGVAAAGVTFAAVATRPRDALGPRGGVETVAGFGWIVLGLLIAAYVNVPGVESLGGIATAAVAAVLAVGVGLAVRLGGESSAGRRGGVT